MLHWLGRIYLVWGFILMVDNLRHGDINLVKRRLPWAVFMVAITIYIAPAVYILSLVGRWWGHLRRTNA